MRKLMAPAKITLSPVSHDSKFSEIDSAFRNDPIGVWLEIDHRKTYRLSTGDRVTRSKLLTLGNEAVSPTNYGYRLAYVIKGQLGQSSNNFHIDLPEKIMSDDRQLNPQLKDALQVFESLYENLRREALASGFYDINEETLPPFNELGLPAHS